MEKMIDFVKHVSSVKEIDENITLQQLINDVVLPHMAYRAEQRRRIGDDFMIFMSEFALDICRKDGHLGDILLEIAMQRLSDGAVLHPEDPTPIFEALPKEYHTYASASGFIGGEPGLMGVECEDFIIRALPICLERSATHRHALAIAFGLVHYLNEDGKTQDRYMLGSSYYSPDGKMLFILAKQWVEKYACDEDIFRHYAQPNQWRKHLEWFAQLDQKGKLDWAKFFKETKADGEGNFFKKWRKKREVAKEIKAYA